MSLPFILVVVGSLFAPLLLLILAAAACARSTRRPAVQGLMWGGGAAALGALAALGNVLPGFAPRDVVTLSAVAFGAGGAFTWAVLAALAVHWWRRPAAPRNAA